MRSRSARRLARAAARIVRQLLTESLVLAGHGGAAGVVVVALMLQNAHRGGAGRHPASRRGASRSRRLHFAIGITVLSAVLVGLLPALRAGGAWYEASASANLWHEALASSRGSSGGARASRIRGTLVVAQVALALVLLVGAGTARAQLHQAEHDRPRLPSRWPPCGQPGHPASDVLGSQRAVAVLRARARSRPRTARRRGRLDDERSAGVGRRR